MQWRLVKEGYETSEIATMALGLHEQNIQISRAGQTPAGMVSVPRQARSGSSDIMPLPDYFLDKFEVSNHEFQNFLDVGGYKTPKYWRYPFRKDGREIPFEQAVASFRDTTGRPGPARWELGTFQKDRADYPVSGVSWLKPPHIASTRVSPYRQFITGERLRVSASSPISCSSATSAARVLPG